MQIKNINYANCGQKGSQCDCKILRLNRYNLLNQLFILENLKYLFFYHYKTASEWLRTVRLFLRYN